MDPSWENSDQLVRDPKSVRSIDSSQDHFLNGWMKSNIYWCRTIMIAESESVCASGLLSNHVCLCI